MNALANQQVGQFFGQAFVAIAILGLILHTATLWAFRRLTA